MIVLEVCAESVDSAVIAQECGAARIEFCDNMAEGGTTQSAGSIRTARERLSIALFPIIRPRGGDFVYTDTEFDVMIADVFLCGQLGCDGIVTGILHPDGTVDKERTKELVGIAAGYGMEVTFHRAFDVCRDLRQALEDVIETGCKRILTSGGAATVPEGMEVIGSLVEQAAGRIILMPGSGVTPGNVAEIVSRTGCREIHGTFRSQTASSAYAPGWADFTRWQPDPVKISKVLENTRDL